jgi:hypothetical protein
MVAKSAGENTNVRSEATAGMALSRQANTSAVRAIIAVRGSKTRTIRCGRRTTGKPTQLSGFSTIV